MSFVVDASVVVKVFVDEPHSEIARALFSQDDVLLAPAHVLGEVGEVLVRRYFSGEIGRIQLDLVAAVLPGSLAIVDLDQIFAQAIDIAVSTRTSVYDTLYIATALRWNALLLTSDLKLVSRLKETEWAGVVRPLADWRPVARDPR